MNNSGKLKEVAEAAKTKLENAKAAVDVRESDFVYFSSLNISNKKAATIIIDEAKAAYFKAYNAYIAAKAAYLKAQAAAAKAAKASTTERKNNRAKA